MVTVIIIEVSASLELLSYCMEAFSRAISYFVLRIELWIWRRTANRLMPLAQRFVLFENTLTPQIQLIMDGEVNSKRGHDAHFTLIKSYRSANQSG